MRIGRLWQFVAVAAAAGSSSVAAQGLAHVTLEYENAPLSQVAQNFATFTGQPVVLGPDIGEQLVTTSVSNVAWDVALDQILATKSLVARPLRGGALQIERERRLNLDFESAPLSGVLRSVERFAGRTIVLSEAAGDPWITVSIHDTDWQRALNRIANAAGLVARSDQNGVFHVEKRP